MNDKWPPAVVEVSWIDSMSHHGWDDQKGRGHSLDEEHVLEQQTAGYLVKETESYLAITHTIGIGVKNYSCTTQIPKCAVTKITRLRRGHS